MPVKLSTGLTRKIGQPNFGSVGASCQIDSELDPMTLEFDLDSLQQRIRDCYEICNDAVNAELLRQTQVSSADHFAAGHGIDSGSGHSPGKNGREATRRRRPATPAQLRAIRAIVAENNHYLDAILADGFSVTAIEQLSVAEASQLIDFLRTLPSVASSQH